MSLNVSLSCRSPSQRSHGFTLTDNRLLFLGKSCFSMVHHRNTLLLSLTL